MLIFFQRGKNRFGEVTQVLSGEDGIHMNLDNSTPEANYSLHSLDTSNYDSNYDTSNIGGRKWGIGHAEEIKVGRGLLHQQKEESPMRDIRPCLFWYSS